MSAALEQRVKDAEQRVRDLEAALEKAGVLAEEAK